jgi:hypothetical protein
MSETDRKTNLLPIIEQVIWWLQSLQTRYQLSSRNNEMLSKE